MHDSAGCLCVWLLLLRVSRTLGVLTGCSRRQCGAAAPSPKLSGGRPIAIAPFYLPIE